MRKASWKLLLLGLLIFAKAHPVLCAETAQDFYALAGQFYKTQDYSKAIVYYQKYLSLEPQDAAAYVGLGNSYYRLGKKDEALWNYERALALKPDDTQVSSFVQSLNSQSASPGVTFVIGPANLPQEQETPAVETPPKSGVELDFMGSLDVPNQNSQIEFGLGYGAGGRISGGYKFDPSFSLLATAAYLTFNYSSHSTSSGGGSDSSLVESFHTACLEFLGGIKYRLGNSRVNPYLLAGAGISNLMSASTILETSSGVTVTNQDQTTNNLYPVLEMGGGVELPLGKAINFFAQAQYGIIFITDYSTTQSSAGTTTISGYNGSVFSYVPVEVGLNLNL